jgi:translocation and assembly module TamA
MSRRALWRPARTRHGRQWILLGLALACLLQWPAAHGQVRVEIDGVDSEIEANIRATLNLVRHGAREDLSDAAVRRLHARARSQIRDAMRPFGYYRPQIEPQLEQREGRWLASFRIDPGDPVIVRQVDVRISGEGALERRFGDIIADSELKEGRRLRHQEYDRLRTRLQGEAANLGFFEARFEEHRLEVDVAELSARAILHLETGPRYQFGRIEITQDELSTGLLERIVRIREGEPYDAARLLQAQYRLTDSLYFASVVVETGVPDADSRSVPIHIDTSPTRRQRIRLGVGYATDTQVRASLGVDWRRLNTAGHSAGTELRLSRTLTELSGRYRIPIRDPLNERLLFRGSLSEEDLGDIQSRRASLGISHVTVRGGGWQRTLFTDILDERTRLPEEPDFTDTLVVPGLGMEKLIADDILFPLRGYRLRGELRGSQALLGASSDFLRLDIEANLVTSIGEQWRFFARSRLGVGFVERFGQLPASQRFFAGGDQSVRGYGFNSLAPRDEAGNVVGGRHLVFGSLEAERRVWGRVAVAAFLDAGNALDDFGDSIEASAGGGVNVRTPIGTLRISVARSVTESRSARFHLTIRPDL